MTRPTGPVGMADALVWTGDGVWVEVVMMSPLSSRRSSVGHPTTVAVGRFARPSRMTKMGRG
jgi:hypothetical protein